MFKGKLNIIFFWFVLITCLQLSFGLRAVMSQVDLKNSMNIYADIQQVPLIDEPEKVTDQVLIIFVDGMRFDRMIESNTPNIDSVRANGTTFANFRSVLPSYSRVNYAAFLTGASTNFTDVFANAYSKKLKIPTLFDVIKEESSLTTGIVTGSKAWKVFLEDSSNVMEYFEREYHGYQEDIYVKDLALTSIDANFSNIQIITFGDVDGIGHKYGAASTEYQETIERTDAFIGEILTFYQSKGQLENTTIIIFSDHGMADSGGHGSDADQETHASLIIAGKGVAKGQTTNDYVGMNSVSPTILALLGLPLKATMNGRVLTDFININEKSKSIYNIQQAHILQQQLNLTLNKIRLLSETTKKIYSEKIPYISNNISISISFYNVNNFNQSILHSEIAQDNARLLLSQLYFQYTTTARVLRALTIIAIFTFILFTFFFLFRRKILGFTHQGIFSNIPLVSGISTALVTIITVTSSYLLFGIDFSAQQFNSIEQAVIPNISAFVYIILSSIFLPWLFAYFYQKKKYPEIKGWNNRKALFLQSSISSIFFVSLPIFGFFLYYISKYGPWPDWLLPRISDFYAYMVIVNLSCFIYLLALGLYLVLWRMNKRVKISSEIKV